MLFISSRKKQGKENIQYIIDRGKGRDHIQTEKRIPVGNLHDLMTPSAYHLIMRSHQSYHIIVGRFPKIFRHLDYGPVRSRKADQEGNGFLMLPRRQIMGVNAFIGRTFQPQRGELKHCRLRHYVADTRTVDVDTLRPLYHIVDPVHHIFVKGKPGVGHRLVIQDRKRTDNIRISALIRDGFSLQQLCGDEEAGKAFVGEEAEILTNANWQDIEKNQ